MADYNMICINCGCGPHIGKLCAVCQECRNWLRADVIVAKGMINMNNLLMEGVPRLLQTLVDLVDIMSEVYPEAVARVEAKRKELYEQQQAAAAAASASDSGAGEINTIGYCDPIPGSFDDGSATGTNVSQFVDPRTLGASEEYDR